MNNYYIEKLANIVAEELNRIGLVSIDAPVENLLRYLIAQEDEEALKQTMPEADIPVGEGKTPPKEVVNTNKPYSVYQWVDYWFGVAGQSTGLVANGVLYKLYQESINYLNYYVNDALNLIKDTKEKQVERSGDLKKLEAATPDNDRAVIQELINKYAPQYQSSVMKVSDPSVIIQTQDGGTSTGTRDEVYITYDPKKDSNLRKSGTTNNRELINDVNIQIFDNIRRTIVDGINSMLQVKSELEFVKAREGESTNISEISAISAGTNQADAGSF